jgi:hypothetical protein
MQRQDVIDLVCSRLVRGFTEREAQHYAIMSDVPLCPPAAATINP